MRPTFALPTGGNRWLSLLARIAVVGITTYPALQKFLQYPARVAQFEAWGLPFPEIAVLAAGTVQLLAVVTITLGLGGRFGAGALAIVMTVAMATAGPNLFNGTVFISSVVIAALGTGRYSVWDPTIDELTQLPDRVQAGGV
jgi:DoxX.